MDLGISGKRAVVIGGSAGLGLAVADALAAEGVNLLLFSRGRKGLDEAQRALTTAHPVTVDTFAGDLTQRSNTQDLAQTVRGSGGADILIVNSPRPPSPMRDFLDEVDDDRWETAYRDQLEGVLNVLRDLTPALVERGWGRIVGITSASVKNPMPRHAVSTIFRAGVHGALKHLALELADRGVTVNSVAPATVVTPTFAKFHDLQSRIDATPMKRYGTQEELAATVVFLASQQAGFITGETIHVDGGRNPSLV